VVSYPDRPGAVVAYVSKEVVDRRKMVEVAIDTLDRYTVPTHICFVESTTDSSHGAWKRNIPVPNDAVASIING